MIVCHRFRYIFLKTQKTASTSIEIALSTMCGPEDVITPITPEDERLRQEFGGRGPQNCDVPLSRYDDNELAYHRATGHRFSFYNHLPAAKVRQYIGEDVWRCYFKFCFERNPWDRAISHYYWETRSLDPRPPIGDFLESSNWLSNFHVYSLGDEIAVDRIGRYEQLGSDLAEIAKQLRLPRRLVLPYAKATSRIDRRCYRDVLGERERSLIEKACASEIRMLGYEF